MKLFLCACGNFKPKYKEIKESEDWEGYHVDAKMIVTCDECSDSYTAEVPLLEHFAETKKERFKLVLESWHVNNLRNIRKFNSLQQFPVELRIDEIADEYMDEHYDKMWDVIEDCVGYKFKP